MTTIPHGDAGMAASNSEEFNTVELRSGDTPVSTTPEVVAAAAINGADMEAFTVVGRDGAGKLIPAVDGVTNAIGITCSTVLDTAGAADGQVAVFRSGMFNPDALVWDASYNTDEKKRLAFEAAQPTIFIRDILFQA